MKRILICLSPLLILVLAACAAQDIESSGGETPNPDNNPIRWDRNPLTVVFQADVVGGNDANAFYLKNEVPYCTVYGDNRVVWTNPASGSDTQVLWDRLTDQDIRAFVGLLTVDDRFYTYQAGADQQTPSPDQPVYEQLLLAVNGKVQMSDAFSGWPPDYFENTLDQCRKLSKTPVQFEPDSAWVSAKAIDYDTRIPSVIWDAAAGLSLKTLADSGQPQWIKDANAKLLWDMVHSGSIDVQFSEDDGTYQVAVQVPGVTRAAPPAPAS
jgi:hypothetical protein